MKAITAVQEKEQKVSTNNVLKTIYQRRAVRKYRSDKINREIINQLLDAGRMAPSAINKQPWKFYVLTDPEKIKTYSQEIKKAAAKQFLKVGIKEVVSNVSSLLHFPQGLKFIREDDAVFHGAPVVIFITSPKDNEWSDLDIGMCAQNIMLAAESMGLASCPIGFGKLVEKTKSFPQLGIPESERVNIALIIGYGNENPEIHQRKKDNVVFVERQNH